MRKSHAFSVLAAGIALTAMIFACQKAEVQDQEPGLKLKDAYTDCHVQCVSPGGGIYYEVTATKSYQSGGSVTVVTYNTENQIVYKITSSEHDLRKIVFNGETTAVYESNTPASEPFYIKRPLGTWKACDVKTAYLEVRRVNSDGIGAGQYLKFETTYNLVPLCTVSTIEADKKSPVCIGEDVQLTGKVTAGTFDIRGGTLSIQELSGSEWINIGTPVTVGASGNTVSYTYTTTDGPRTFRTMFDGVDSNGKVSQSGSVTVTTTTCDDNPQTPACPEKFDYTRNADGTYTFTYKPPVEKSGANVVFTFAQGNVTKGLDDWTPKGTTMQKTMDLKACEELSWTVTLACKENPGAKNLWTDFTVNGVSKKGNLLNIKCE